MLSDMCTRFLTAVPTAELEPITENYVQADEVGTAALQRTVADAAFCYRRTWA